MVFLPIAENEGFEPPERCKRSTVFKTAAIDHSANSPIVGALQPSRRIMASSEFYMRMAMESRL